MKEPSTMLKSPSNFWKMWNRSRDRHRSTLGTNIRCLLKF